MSRFCFISLLLSVFALTVVPAWSEEEDDEEENTYANEVVVTANRDSEDPFLSNRAVSVVDEKQLRESPPRTMPEALEGTQGVFVQKTNLGGGSPIIRGLVGPQVLILVDGVRLNNSVYRTGPVQYLNMIDPYAVQRIEVLRGPGSVLYGSDAMGGVIQAFPIAPRASDEKGLRGGGTVAARYSSADYGRAGHIHADIGYGPVGVLAGGTYKESDDLIGGRDIGEQVHSGYENQSAIGRACWTFAHGSVTLGYLFNNLDDVGRTDKLYDSNSLQFYDNTDHLAYGKIKADIDPISTETILTLSYQDFSEVKDDKKVLDDYETEESATRDETDVTTLGADWQFSTRVLDERLRFLYGGMWYSDRISAEGFSRNGPDEDWIERADQAYPDGSTYDNYGAFAMIQGDPIFTRTGHILRLNGGYRLHGMRGYAPADNDLDEVDFNYTGNVFLGSVQYLYRNNVNAALTFSQGFRAPNLQESVMFGDTGKFFHVPNKDLKPESADTYEADLHGRFWRLELGTIAYYSVLYDLIIREDTTYNGLTEITEKPVTQTVNGGRGKLWGIEPQASVNLGAGFTLSGFMTYTWGEQKRPDLENKEEPLSRIPPLFGQGLLRYDTENRFPWRAFIEAYGRGAGRQERLSTEDRKDPRIPEGGTPQWWTWNVRTGLLAYDHLRFGLAVENLTNVEYKYHGSGVYGPGTNAILTTEIFF